MDGSFTANRQGIPFASLAFVMLKSSPVVGFYDTPFCTVCQMWVARTMGLLE